MGHTCMFVNAPDDQRAFGYPERLAIRIRNQEPQTNTLPTLDPYRRLGEQRAEMGSQGAAKTFPTT